MLKCHTFAMFFFALLLHAWSQAIVVVDVNCQNWPIISYTRNCYTGISYWKQCLQAPLTNLSTFLDTLSLLSCSLKHRAQRSYLWPWLQLNCTVVNVYCRIEYGEYERHLSNRLARVTNVVKYYPILGRSIKWRFARFNSIKTKAMRGIDFKT